MIRAGLVLLILAPVQTGAFSLQWPVDCTLGDSCFIQQYPDRDLGPGATDFTCGPLSYDTHSGTDIALPSLSAMHTGVAVRAAADGIVRATRDGMADIASNAPNAPKLDRNQCGNAVILTHDGGWETSYCHMQKGSVAVRQGDIVKAGTPLGQIGLSGETEFPHLHIGLRKNGQIIDPFDPDGVLTCDAPPAPTLWQTPVPYQPGGLITVGISIDVPEFETVKAGLPQKPVLPAKAPALVIWAHLFGVRDGDSLRFSLTGPDGSLLSEIVPLTRTQARVMRALGKRLRGPAAWPSGVYTGAVTLIRKDAEISRQEVTVQVKR